MTSNEAKELLRSYLHDRKLGQKEFAREIGKSEVTISRWLSPTNELSQTHINSICFIVEAGRKKLSYPHEENRSHSSRRINDLPRTDIGAIRKHILDQVIDEIMTLEDIEPEIKVQIYNKLKSGK